MTEPETISPDSDAAIPSSPVATLDAPTETNTSTGFPPPSQPQPAPEPRFRLVRARHDRKIAGVCGGLANTFDVDPTLVRIGMLAAIASGFGIWLYLAAWLLAPVSDHI
ncbi:MAG: PspC domain-containing protein [Ilumatobacteraceae bacterium]